MSSKNSIATKQKTERFEPEDITFHYTDEDMVKDCMIRIPFDSGDKVLDAGSGKNKVWYRNIPKTCIASECEISDGVDFLEITDRYDWIIGNPPFHEGYDFTAHAFELADKGIAMLGNINYFNSLFTPKRMEKMKEQGFGVSGVHVVQDKRWFGRYFFVIFQKLDIIGKELFTYNRTMFSKDAVKKSK